MSHTNPLLDFTDHPLFDAIRPEHIAPALEPLLADANHALEKVTAADFPADWPPKSSAVLGVPSAICIRWPTRLSCVPLTPKPYPV
jgi:hypothetical protein